VLDDAVDVVDDDDDDDEVDSIDALTAALVADERLTVLFVAGGLCAVPCGLLPTGRSLCGFLLGDGAVVVGRRVAAFDDLLKPEEELIDE
jgi:hypothetical protein